MEELTFPRELLKIEKELLFSVLPLNKPGYNAYRQKIDSLVVTGEGKFGGCNLVLGQPGTVPDISLPSLPVFALGNMMVNDSEVSVIIHEEFDNEIEIDLSFTGGPVEDNALITGWSYSEWNPGEKAPGDNSQVREMSVVPGRYILVIAPVHKKLWLHNKANGVNLLIPVTNYYNSLMIIKNIRNADVVLKSSRLFSELESYTNEELISAFLAYNKYFKRIKID